MEIVDLRQYPSRSLEPLFQQETRRWRDELHWDYRPSIELIRKFIDSRALGGYVVTEQGKPAGYGFYVLEEHKGLIGWLFVSSDYDQEPITRKLVSEMVSALHATPRLVRVEAQLMPFGTELNPEFLSQFFRLHTRQFMYLPLEEAKLSGKPLSASLRLEQWSDRAFEPAARLIQLAYANHVDGEINDQYRSRAGALRFLKNIILLPGCGQFVPGASFVLRQPGSDELIAAVLTSEVSPGVGHTTQICVLPGYQGHGLGRMLMQTSAEALRAMKFRELTLTVTSQNRSAVQLYENLHFTTIRSFTAGVWPR
jgi:ribosomal protein S18 acetylase RimI-like enzyme